MAQLFVPTVGLQLQNQTFTQQNIDTSIPNSANPAKALDPVTNMADSYFKYQQKVEDTQNETEAQDQLNQVNEEISKLQTDLQNSDGEDANNLYKDYDNKVKAIIDKHSEGLSSGALFKYNRQAGAVKANASAQGYATHVYKSKQWNNEVMGTAIKNTAQQATAFFGTPEFENQIAKGQEQVRQMLEANGKAGNQEIVNSTLRAFASDVYKNSIMAEVNQDQVGNAAKHLHQYKERMDQNDVLTIESAIYQKQKSLARQAMADAMANRQQQISSLKAQRAEFHAMNNDAGDRMESVVIGQIAKLDPALAGAMQFHNKATRAQRAVQNIKTARENGDKPFAGDLDTILSSADALSASDIADIRETMKVADSSFTEKLVDSLGNDAAAQYEATKVALENKNLTELQRVKMQAVQDKITDDRYFDSLNAAKTTENWQLMGQQMYKMNAQGEYLTDNNGNYQLTDLAQRAQEADPTRFSQMQADWLKGNAQASSTRLQQIERDHGYTDHEKLILAENYINALKSGDDSLLNVYMQFHGLDPKNKGDREKAYAEIQLKSPKIRQEVIDAVNAQNDKYYAAHSYKGQQEYLNMQSTIAAYQKMYYSHPELQQSLRMSTNKFGRLPADFQRRIRDTFGDDKDGFDKFVTKFENAVNKDIVGDKDKFNATMRGIKNGLYDGVTQNEMNALCDSFYGTLSTGQIDTLKESYENRMAEVHKDLMKSGAATGTNTMSQFIFDQNYNRLEGYQQDVVNAAELLLKNRVTTLTKGSTDPRVIKLTTDMVLDDPNFKHEVGTLKEQGTTMNDLYDNSDYRNQLDKNKLTQKDDSLYKIHKDPNDKPWTDYLYDSTGTKTLPIKRVRGGKLGQPITDDTSNQNVLEGAE